NKNTQKSLYNKRLLVLIEYNNKITNCTVGYFKNKTSAEEYKESDEFKKYFGFLKKHDMYGSKGLDVYYIKNVENKNIKEENILEEKMEENKEEINISSIPNNQSIIN